MGVLRKVEVLVATGGVLLALLVLAAGCFGGSPVPAVYKYRLSYEPPAVEEPPLPVVLRVASFHIASTYARDGIVYRAGDYEVDSYYYRRWSTSPASMVADMLSRDLAASGRYQAVQRGPSILPNDYVLGGEVEEIEERLGNGCTAHLRMRILLTRLPLGAEERPVFQNTYAADEPCAKDDVGDLVAAMSRAMSRISSQVQRDVYEAVSARSDED